MKIVEFQKQVLYTLSDLKQQVANISTTVRHISSVLLEKEAFQNDEICDIQFPLKTLAQLKDLEDRMSDKEFSKQMVGRFHFFLVWCLHKIFVKESFNRSENCHHGVATT